MENSLLDNIVVRKQGRRQGPATLMYVRDLDEGDRGELENPAPRGEAGSYNGTNNGLQRLRHTHHLLAMALANGASVERASMLTGYAPATIYILQTDPTFKNLICHYRTAVMAEFQEVHDRAASLGLSFLDELQERLEESPGAFTNKELLASAEMLLDRTIMPSRATGPQSPTPSSQPAVLRVEFVSASPKELSPAPTGTIIEGKLAEPSR